MLFLIFGILLVVICIVNCWSKWEETKKSQGFKYDNSSSKEEYEMLENLFQEKLLDEENKGYNPQNGVFERRQVYCAW